MKEILQEKDYFSKLPDEIKDKIFSHLSWETLINTRILQSNYVKERTKIQEFDKDYYTYFNKIIIICGGRSTGKTVILNDIIQKYQDFNRNAYSMFILTVNASTIHVNWTIDQHINVLNSYNEFRYMRDKGKSPPSLLISISKDYIKTNQYNTTMFQYIVSNHRHLNITLIFPIDDYYSLVSYVKQNATLLIFTDFVSTVQYINKHINEYSTYSEYAKQAVKAIIKSESIFSNSKGIKNHKKLIFLKDKADMAQIQYMTVFIEN